MDEERVKINLHEFDNDRESICKGFRDAALEQGWDNAMIEDILRKFEGKSVNQLLENLSKYTVPDYSWSDYDDEENNYSYEDSYQDNFINDFYNEYGRDD